jgi:HEAT repeat protein
MMLLALLCLWTQDLTLDQAVRHLGDESPELRDRASAWIYRQGQEAVPVLRKALAGAEAEVRGRVEMLLHRIEWEPLVPVSLLARVPEAREAFRRGDHAGFLEVLRARPGWNHGGAEEVEAYAIRLLGLQDPLLQFSAVEILQLSRQERNADFRRPVKPLVDFLCQWIPGEWDDLARVRLMAIFELVHDRSSTRDLGILASGKPKDSRAERLLRILRAGIGDSSCTPALLESLATDESPWRHLALMAAEKSGCTEAAPAVAKLLDSDAVGWLAWKAMNRVFEPSVGDLVIAACRKRPLKDLAAEGLRLLARIGTPEAMGILREALTVSETRNQAAFVLAERGDRSGVGILLDFYEQGGALSSILDASKMVDGSTVVKLLKLLDSPDKARCFAVANAVTYIRDPLARQKTLLRFGEERDPEVRRLMLEGMDFWNIDLGDSLESLARDWKDPLAPPAAAMLVKSQGARRLPLVEALLDRGANFQSRVCWSLLGTAPSPLLVRLGQDPQWMFPVINTLAERGAKAELAGFLDNPAWGGRAATALIEADGDVGELVKSHADVIFWDRLDVAAERNVAGVRELLRARMKAGLLGQEGILAFRKWALPEMLPAFRKRLAEYDAGRSPDIGEPQPPELCAMTLPGPNFGFAALSAIGSTGDPSSLPLLLERLNDPEPGMQATAMKAVARRKAPEAAPILRQIALSGRSWIRGQALLALADIGVPGTEGFLREHLRDNPTTAPAALARLGVDARDAIRALRADGAPPGPLLSAIELLTNRDVYRGLDSTLWSARSSDVEGMILGITGHPCRMTKDAIDHGVVPIGADSFREFLEGVGRANGAHVVRDGVIVICTVDEAH